MKTCKKCHLAEAAVRDCPDCNQLQMRYRLRKDAIIRKEIKRWNADGNAVSVEQYDSDGEFGLMCTESGLFFGNVTFETKQEALSCWERATNQPKDNIASLFVTQWVQLELDERSAHEDVSIWGAPSECHDDVSSLSAKQWREFEDAVEYIWPSWKDFISDLKSRGVTEKWLEFGIQKAVMRHPSPFDEPRRTQ